MSEYLFCYDCGSVRDVDYHATRDCKTIARLRADLRNARGEGERHRAEAMRMTERALDAEREGEKLRTLAEVST